MILFLSLELFKDFPLKLEKEFDESYNQLQKIRFMEILAVYQYTNAKVLLMNSLIFKAI